MGRIFKAAVIVFAANAILYKLSSTYKEVVDRFDRTIYAALEEERLNSY